MGALVFLIGYYGICSCVLYEGGVIGQAKKLHRELSSGQRAAAALALILGAGLTVYWMGRNQFVYYWDYGEYWRMSIQGWTICSAITFWTRWFRFLRR